MKLKRIFIIAILVTMFTSFGYSKPRKLESNGNPFKFAPSPNTLIAQRIRLNANNVDAYFQNSGIFNQNTTATNSPGLYWPKGQTTKAACFTAGLSIGCMINTATGLKMAQVMASYKGEWAPSYVPSPPDKISGPQTDFKMYMVRAGDNASTNPDYANWYKMIPYGAPYDDVNHNGTYDDGTDIPGMKTAAQTIFMCQSDAMVSERNPGEGFGGGVNDPILFAEVRFTAWAYTSPGLEDMQFINWVIINKDTTAWYRTYTGVVVDPDLGDANDDYIGCDTTINMGYCYNGDNDDPVYGISPPAFGMEYFRSPVIRATNDTLGLTSFSFFTNNGNSPPPCESDPNGEPKPAYLMLMGVKKDSSSFLDPTYTPPKRTKFVYPGDPESNSGWTEFKGSINNCGGDSGAYINPNPKGDRRFIFSSGREDFVMNPGDTQNIIVAQFVQRGSSNLNSVTKLKRLGLTARIIYDRNFNVTPPPPPPVVNYAFNPTNRGRCNITLNWGDISESYRYWDSIFHEPDDTNIYLFQGYEVYELSKNIQSVPDFNKPETIDPTVIRLIDIFDKNDNIGVVIDTFQTYEGQFSPFPICPPYKMSVPNGFPNKGISRSITLTGTQFGENYGGETKFIYGQEYKFSVTAYAVSISHSDTLKKGFRLIRNSVGSLIITIKPVAPPAGTDYTMKNGDTLNLSFPFRDLGLAPIIRNQDLLKNATYRVQFGLDTTYMIMRKLAGSNTFTDTLQRGLKWVSYKPTADDSSRTFDGIFFNLQKLRYVYDGTLGGWSGNVGVLPDPSSTLKPDSIQTRKNGWEYNPRQNLFFEGAKTTIANGSKPAWQNKTMSMFYPTKINYNGIGSKLLPSGLRSVKIKYTGYGNGQRAYRYLSNTADSIADPSYLPYVVRTKPPPFYSWLVYQDKREVPFKVFVNDPNDSANGRQLNCAFVEANLPRPAGLINGKFEPTADSTGSRRFLYIFNSNYSDSINWDPIYTDTIGPLGLWFTSRYDIMYIWAPKLINSQSNFTVGDEFNIYPYTFQRPFYDDAGTMPFFYEFSTVAPDYANNEAAKNAIDKITVVPNPYYGFSSLDRGSVDKFVTFRNLPLECTIKIYSLNGDLVNTITKTRSGNISTSSTAEWNLQNQSRVPVASGIYVALIDAPGIGQKIIKIVVFVSQERLNF
jgi:hypothetical protein